MRCRWSLALVALLIAPSVWAQRGGGHGGGAHSGGSMSHSGFASHGPAMAAPMTTTGHGGMTWSSHPTGGQFHSGFHNPPFNRGFNRRSRFVTFPWGYYYPYYSYYPYADYGYSNWSDSNSYPAPYPYSNDNYVQADPQQQAEIDRLEDEVERLKEQRGARTQPQQQPKSEAHDPTVLVFNDKHTQQVENYAIVGQTLWVFSELRATKIPLSSLDIDATTKANDERGVDFHVPN